MARIFITGSADGLGQMAANALIAAGHQVVLHARNEKRGKEALDKAPGAETVVVGNLASIADTKLLANRINDVGAFDAVIHNAGVYNAPGETLFTVNTLAPYILTCLLHKPERLVYLSSAMHMAGNAKLPMFTRDLNHIDYSDTKLHVVMLCKAVARQWTDVYANVLNPGWVATKMGGRGAPDSLQKGYETQVWLATSNDNRARVSGRYFYHQEESHYNPEADEITLQERFMELCEEMTGVHLPRETTHLLSKLA